MDEIQTLEADYQAELEKRLGKDMSIGERQEIMRRTYREFFLEASRFNNLPVFETCQSKMH